MQRKERYVSIPFFLIFFKINDIIYIESEKAMKQLKNILEEPFICYCLGVVIASLVLLVECIF